MLLSNFGPCTRYFSGSGNNRFKLQTLTQVSLSFTSSLRQRSSPISNSQTEKLSSKQEFSCKNAYNPLLVQELLNKMKDDTPFSDIPDPYAKDYRRCFLCRQNVQLDHKNVRLLSQFVSSYTGRIYGRAITGLCIPMQRHVSKLIKRARLSGYMPFILKDPKYLRDPQPYDTMSIPQKK
ncbi:28S ribosomal protein S18c, mitochondrial [Bulinus truncatus]|nr:28S ribosomal protein S18c, mitochondrial [Bulinus truncatus]